jgi:hypothetical protein
MLNLIVGNKYKWQHTAQILVYLGENWSGNGYWHQFAKEDDLDKVWCEVRKSELHLFQEVVGETS